MRRTSKRYLDRYEMPENVEMAETVQPVLIVDPNDGEISAGGTLANIQAAIEEVKANTEESGNGCGYWAKHSAYGDQIMVSRPTKRDAGGIDHEADTGTGADLVITANLGELKEVSAISIVEVSAANHIIALDSPALIEISIDGTNWTALEGIEDAAAAPSLPHTLNGPWQIWAVKVTIEASVSPNVYHLSAAYWDM